MKTIISKQLMSCLYLYFFKIKLACLFLIVTCLPTKSQTLHDSIPYYTNQFDELVNNEELEEAIFAARKIIRGYGIQFPDSSYFWAKNAYELALKTKKPNLIIERLATIGRFTFVRQLYEEAVLIYEKVDSLILEHPHDKAHTQLLYNLAEGYEYTARPELGMLTYQRCYEKALATENVYVLAKLDIKMGNLHKMEKQLKKALDFFAKAVSRTNKKDPDLKRLYYTARINYVSVVLNAPDSFSMDEKRYFSKVVDTIYQNFLADEDMRRFLPTITEKKIKIALLSENQEAIQAIFLPSIDSIKSHTSNSEYLHSRFALYFEVAMAQKKLSIAEMYLNENGLVVQENNLVQKLNYLSQKKEWLVANQDYQTALAVADEIHTIDKKLYNQERASNIDNLEGQIAAAEKQIDLERLTSRNENLRNFGIFAFIIFAIILTFWLMSRKKNKIISAQNQQLTQLNITKDQIFAVLGHDLRKPAISFRGITQKLRYLIDQKDFKTMEALGNVLEKNAFALNQLTDNLLNWALTQKDAISYQPTNIQLDEAMEEVMDLFQTVAADKSIGLTSSIGEGQMLYADLNSFLIIIRNLVDNALKFTPKGGTVEVNSSIKNEGMVIKIKDSGIGIPPQELASIFTLKKNKSARGTVGEKGTGLGLHLVNELVKINQGSIDISSQLEKGTTIKVTFPMSSKIQKISNQQINENPFK